MQIDQDSVGGTRHFQEATRQDVFKLIKEFGTEADLDEAQNDSPTVIEMLDLTATYPDMTYHGFVVDKPRDDYRVSLEGFEVKNITADQAIELLKTYNGADTCNADKVTDNKYNLYTWWD